ncbi:MAG: hypothetical protein HY556_10845 [Euryarchaeota archaeon]|nr:hypothetical protein [Euryarchaeota archaeon]
MARPRITFFTGKGGTGKTTISEAFALGASLAGRKTLLFSLQHRATRQRAAAEPFEHLEFKPRLLVDEAFHNFLKFPLVSHMVTGSAAYDSFVDVAPGVKEMAVLNRLRDIGLAGRHDEIVVDGLATGHGAAFFEAPGKSEAMLVGKLKDRCRAIRVMLEDPSVTRVVVVTTPEEVAVRETADLLLRLREAAMTVRAIVVNKNIPPMFERRRSQATLLKLARGQPRASDTAVEEAARALVVILARSKSQQEQAQLLRDIGLPLVEAPMVFGDSKAEKLSSTVEGLL